MSGAGDELEKREPSAGGMVVRGPTKRDVGAQIGQDQIGEDQVGEDQVGEDQVGEDQTTCFVCRAVAPPTDTDYTLISSAHGWRLAARVGADGRKAQVWYCPSCWKVFRKARTTR